MPQIPLYNKGLGPQVRTATGRLSPRASSAAFEQVGLAQAQLGQAISDVSKVAAEFEIARQDAETDQIAEEYSNQIRDAYRTLNSQPTSDINQYRESERVVRQGFMDGVDGMGQLGSRQKQALKDKVNKYAGLFSAEGERAAFTRFIGKASETANKRATNILGSITSGTMPLEMGLAEHDEHYDRSVARGYDMAMTKEQFRFAALGELLTVLSLDETKTFGDLDAVDEKIMRGLDEYSGLGREQREALSGILDGRMQFLENEAIVSANETFTNTVASAEKATNPLFRDDILKDAYGAIQTMRDFGMPQKASEMQQTLDVARDVLKSRDVLRFADEASVNDYLGKLNEDARAAIGTDRAYKAEQAYRKARELMNTRGQEIDTDPALYVTENFAAVYNKTPTPEQNLQRQRDMGIPDGKIRLLTAQQAKEFTTSIAEAQNANEVAQLLRFPAATERYYLRQLRAAGVSLADMYMSKGPITLTTDQLFMATRKDAIKIQVTPVARQNVRVAVLGDATVQSHMKSMLGGSYADLENRTVRGAVSDTRSGHEARDEHIDMLTDLTLFLIQEDRKLVTGDAKLDPSEIKPYAEAAAEILEEKFAYIDGAGDTFPNKNVSLRIPAHRGQDAVKITLGLQEITQALPSDEIFFETNLGNEEGTPEFRMEKDAYVAGIKEGYGWVANNDGVTATLVDASGGVVFRDDDGTPVPVQASFDDAIAESGARQRRIEAIGPLINELEGQRKALSKTLVTGGALSALGVGTPEYNEQKQRNKGIKEQLQTLSDEIDRLKRSRADIRRGN